MLLKLPIQFDREITKIVSLKLLPVHKKLNSLGLAFVWQYLFSKFLNAACMLWMNFIYLTFPCLKIPIKFDFCNKGTPVFLKYYENVPR